MVSKYYALFLVSVTAVICQIDIITESVPLIDRGACISNPCLHSGLCTVTPSGFICTCMNGFIGVQCERRADDCPNDNKMDCIHGICKLDLSGNPRCICNDGYEGPACSIATDDCALKPCQNNGQCIDRTSGYECKCSEGTYGSHCQIKHSAVQQCLTKCDGYVMDGKCWHNDVQNLTVGWGYGDYICNSHQTCFNTTLTKDVVDDFDYMEVQLKPVHMQYTDNLVFITDRDAILYDYHFIPHILPMEAQSKESFLTCNTSNAVPLTDESDISYLSVNESLLQQGTQYFIADMNSLHRCVFGLRLNVTVKDKDCVDPVSTKSEICNGHGKCFSDFSRSSYECLCCEGFMGDYCQYEDPCFANPCSNEAHCEVVDYGAGILKHKCVCPNGYHGVRCQKLVDYCLSNPCEHEAACYPKLNGYACKCKLGFSGKNCETNNDECKSSPCHNNGTCLDGLNAFHCACADGFEGTLCEINIDDCSTFPCLNGTCLDEINNYTCACQPGTTGRNCEVVLDECDSQPCINGKCVNEDNGFSCSCGIGYTGMLCEIKLDLCAHSKYCINEHAQSCVDHGNKVSCDCMDGWAGDNCGVNINECTKNNCQNGGQCIDQMNRYDCKCKKKFSGLYCEVAPPKIIPDIEIEFMAIDSCSKFKTPQGLQHLEENIVSILGKACHCPLKVQSLKLGSTRIVCKDKMAGTFMTDLAVDDIVLQKEIVCGMDTIIKTENTPNIYHKTYLVSIVDNSNLCSSAFNQNVTIAVESSSSTTGVVIGVLLGFILLIATLVFISFKLRNTRTKIGVTHKFEKEAISFDNAAYSKEQGDDEEFDEAETSFTSSDCPKWAEGYDRARTLYERNRAAPAGRLFDFSNPGGDESKI